MGGAQQTAEAAAIPDEPPLSCDIVMKGGITSGVVYPGAVLRLAQRYRFRSIGGTSAGAIAAAVVAAAEHNRRGGGFVEVAKLPGELASTTPDCRPFMLQLFQPDGPTRALFDSVISLMRDGKVYGGIAMLVRFWKGPLTALVVAAGSIVLSAVAGADPAFAVAGVACALVIGLVGLLADLLRAVQKISDNHFGMCRLGPPDHRAARGDALTPWLHKKIQAVAGTPLDRPVTFADLWGVPRPATEHPWEDEDRWRELKARNRTARDREVDLQMVTTDLTHGRPLRLPVNYQRHEDTLEDEGGRLLFDPEELATFFPEEVVAHLKRFSYPLQSSRETVARLTPHGRTLLRFPIGPDLPIVVATRMSLSFPFLISAIPLWRLEYQPGGAPPQLHRVIFSDGGVTSNFPIHFFDSPLPTRPTFGLNLTSFDRNETPDLDDPARAVVPPGPVGDPARETRREIDGLGSFFGALKNAAQNWRDNAQAALPGYRDRIVHIKLADDEGGLNLAMPAKTIRRMNARGDVSGATLMELFSGADGSAHATHWNDHRFTRFRVVMGQLERLLETFARSYAPLEGDPPLDDVTESYVDRIGRGLQAPYPYANQDVLDAAENVARAYVELVTEAEHSLDEGTPRPPSVLRSVPPT